MTREGGPHSPGVPAWVWGAAAASGLVAVYLATTQDLSFDEANRWFLSQRPPAEIVRLNVNITQGNELFLLFLHGAGAVVSSPRFWRLVSLLAHVAAVTLSWRIFSEHSVRTAGFVALWIAASPLHLSEAYDLKEYSLGVLLGLGIVHFSAPGRTTSLTKVALLGLVEAAGTGVTLAMSPFWGAVALGQIWLQPGKWGRKGLVLLLQHLPMALLTAFTLWRWDPRYKPLFRVMNGEIVRNDPLRIIGDFFAHVYVWSGLPGTPDVSPCGSPPPEWFWPVLGMGAWVVGGSLFVLIGAGMAGRGGNDGRRLVLWWGWLGLAPLGIYYLGSLLLGSPHVYPSRMYLAASPFVFGAVGVGISALPKALGAILFAPAAVSAVLMMGLLIFGHHAAQPDRLKRLLSPYSSSLEPRDPVYVYPGVAFHQVLSNAPGVWREHLRAVGNNILEEPLGDGSLVAPAHENELSVWADQLSSPEQGWLILYPQFLIVRDPARSVLRRSGKEWRLAGCNRTAALYRTP
ncbi:MAG: hypothetical protein HYT87_07980 [Nitrospirae bacterium]|nr:hypothetical protein [Nitrospirota bacterium]